MVWLTGMGLALGLLMIMALLGVIVIKGLETFWPKRLVEIRLAEGSSARIGSSDVLVGEIVQQRPSTIRDPETDEEILEWQIFIANKDAYGQPFRYVPVPAMTSVGRPDGFLRVERAEHGPLIGRAVRVVGSDGAVIEGSTPEFDTELRRFVDEAESIRDQIDDINRGEIGRLNAVLRSIRIDRIYAARDGDVASVQALDARSQELEKRYEVLATKVADLRGRLAAQSLVCRLATGEEHLVSVGEILDFVRPNDMNFVQRVGRFFVNLWRFVRENPRNANTEGGIFPAIFGTFVMTVMLSAVVTPFGVIAAIYLREYSKDGPVVRIVRVAINNLAGVPSIVFGAFGLGFFVYVVGSWIDRAFFPQEIYDQPTFGTGGIFWASLTLALLTLPVVIIASEEAMAAVSRGMREGSLACGASKWQTIWRVVLPASAPGIMTGMILAMARGAGEVAPLMLVGMMKEASSLPIDGQFPFLHLDRKFMHLGFHIYDVGFQSPDSEAARPIVFATTLLLITLVVSMNLGAIFIRERLRRRFSTGAF